MRTTLTSVLILGCAAGAVRAQVYPAQMVIKNGDASGTSTISDLNDPYTNGLNEVGFVASLADNSRAIYAGGTVVFNSSSDPNAVGAEGTMGISDAHDFLYSPTYSGADAVYTASGVLLKDGDPAPGFPGTFSTFNSRPRMMANGTAVWIGGTGLTVGGSTNQRVMYKNPTPATPGATVPVFAGGHLVGTEAVTAQGIGFAYDMSDNAAHYINVVNLGVSTATDLTILVDGVTIAAREGGTTGQGDAWQNFGGVGVNNSGQFVYSGDTNGATATDGFVAGPTGILLREGSSIAGKTYSGAIDSVSINNNGMVAFIADTGGTTEALFRAPLNDFSQAVLLLETGAGIDTDGDTVADYTVTDFNASLTIAPGLDLPDDGSVYVNVDISSPGGAALGKAIIRLGAPNGPSCDSIDFNNDTLFPDTADIDDFLSVFSGGPCSTDPAPGCNDIDFNNDTLFPDTTDIDSLLSVFSGGPCL